MIPWETIDQARIPGSNEILALRKRGHEYSIRTPETELMNSRVSGSEEILAESVTSRLTGQSGPHLLIGGLGMGFTLAAALKNTPEDIRITVSELIPAVVDWNRQFLGPLSGNPMDDARVIVKIEDVMMTIQQQQNMWDGIILDVDNGPAGLTHRANDRLYAPKGLRSIHNALKTGGWLAVWSAADDPQFTRRLKKNGFSVELLRVRARKSGKGSRHTIWLAQK